MTTDVYTERNGDIIILYISYGYVEYSLCLVFYLLLSYHTGKEAKLYQILCISIYIKISWFICSLIWSLTGRLPQ